MRHASEALAGFLGHELQLSSSPAQRPFAPEAAQVQTLKFLIDQVESFEGPQRFNAVCQAAAVGPTDLLQLMFVRGANPHAAWDGISALKWAARRQRSTYSAVQTIVRAMGDETLDDIDLWQLISSSMELFDDAQGKKGLFPLS